jgi:signal transduction histidine kinase
MKPFLRGLLLMSAWLCAGFYGDVARAADPIIRIAEVRALSREAAARSLPVTVRGVVTWRSGRDEFAIQDASGGTWVHVFVARQQQLWNGEEAVLADITVGMVLEIVGVARAAGFAPVIAPQAIRILGTKPLPAARPLERIGFLSGAEAGQRMEAHGVVLGFLPLDVGWKLRMQAGADIVWVIVSKDVVPDPQAILDAEVRVRGVGGSGFNTRGEFLNARILVSIPGDFVVEKPAAPSPFGAPLLPLDRLRAFNPEPEKPQRLRVEGTVTFALPGQFFYLQENTRAVRVESRSDVALGAGDRVEAAGFVDMTRRVGGLGGADVRKIGAGDLPAAVVITPEEIMALNSAAVNNGQAAQPHDFDGHLIRFRAQLLAVQSAPDGKLPWRRLTLKQGSMILGAILHQGDAAALDAMQPDSELEVAGIVQLEYAVVEGARAFLRPVQLDVVLRNAADVTVVRAPSWWTTARLGGVIAIGALMLGGALLWAWQLRRQVHRKTHDLAKEMGARRDAAIEFQATLRERNRLAANLHDTLLQTIGGIGFQLEACDAEAAVPSQDGKLASHLEVARRMLDHAAGELRGSVWTLRSLPMRGLTLPQVLASLAERAGSGHEVRIEVRTEGDLSRVPDFVAGNLLLATQEALHNALKHGQPRTIILEARPAEKPGWIALSIRDDGVGFTPGTQAGPTAGHFGLEGMRERMERLDGTLRIASVPGGGTTIYLEVPLRAYDEDVA